MNPVIQNQDIQDPVTFFTSVLKVVVSDFIFGRRTDGGVCIWTNAKGRRV